MLEILSFSNLNKEYYFNLLSPKVRTKDYNFRVRYLHSFLKNTTEYNELLQNIVSEQKLNDDSEKKLNKAIKEFKKSI